MNNWQQIFTLFITFSLLTFSAYINKYIIGIRLDEANYFLDLVAVDEFSSHTFSIVSKYRLIKRRIEEGDTDFDNYEIESRIQTVLSSDSMAQPLETYQPLGKYHPVKLILQGLRELLGKEQIKYEKISDNLEELENGFIFERDRKYSKALTLYNSLVDGNKLTDKTLSSVLLHKAFCLSMLGKYDSAKSIYKDISNKYSGTSEAILANKLYSFLQSIEMNRKIINTQQYSYESGRDLFLFMDYRGAVEHLGTYLSDISSKNRTRAHYYKGRAHEELGEFSYAINDYRYIMNLGIDNHWARNANRRLVMMGDIYKFSNRSITKAKKILKSQSDTLFLEVVEDMVKMNKTMEKSKNSPKREFKPIVALPSPEVNKVVGNSVKVSANDTSSKDLKINSKKPITIKGKRKNSSNKSVSMNKVNPSERLRSKSFITKTVGSKVIDLKPIYQRYINNGEKVDGRIIIEVEVFESGKISAKVINSNIDNSEFKNDIVKAIEQWKFPPVEGEFGSKKLKLPFDFSEEN